MKFFSGQLLEQAGYNAACSYLIYYTEIIQYAESSLA